MQILLPGHPLLTSCHPHLSCLLSHSCSLSIPDLTPNVGLWWYYLTEMFESFRTFFTGALQLHLLAFAVPVAIRFSKRPEFAFWLLLGISNAFKGYPSIGDVTVTFALLPLFHQAFTRKFYFLASLTLGMISLSPPPSF